MSKIVVVEDNLPIAQMYQFKLETSGYQVQCAYNGKEGLEIIEQFSPELVLLDIKMPVMNGDEMLEKLRAQPWGGKMRVVILTNISRDEAPAKLRLLGVDRYIVKAHHTPQQVLQVIEEILGKKLSNEPS